MFSTLQSLTTRQTSLIRTLRINMNRFLSDSKRELHYTIPSLTSLPELRQVQLSIQTDEGYLTSVMHSRQSYLVDLLLKLPALRPSISVVVMEDGRFFLGQLSSMAAFAKLLKRR